MIHYPDYPAEWNPLANDAADASWQGSPMSMFAKGGRAGCMPFEIKMPKEHVEKMAKGGLAGQAKNVADAGVGGDTMVIHINKDEYKQLTAMMPCTIAVYQKSDGKTYISMMNLKVMGEIYGGDVLTMTEELGPQMDQMLRFD